MATESKRQQIIEAIIAELRDIKKSDGYWFDVAFDSITRRDLIIDQIKDAETPWVSVLPGPEADETVILPKKDEANWDIYIYLVVSAEPDDKRRDLERFLQDVRKKLMANVTLDGLVDTAKVTAVDPPEEDDTGYERFAGTRVTLSVKFRFSWSQP